jgi:hypothetical protein
VRDWTSSYAVWVFWIGLFLVFELIPVFWNVCPWRTLSETSWHAERAYPIVRALVLGFLVGLLIHIVYRVPMWAAMVFGMGFSVLTHIVHFRERV